MDAPRFEFKVAAIVPASYTLTAEQLIYKQGVATRRVALADIRGFAVRELPPAPMGKPLGELLLQLTAGRKKFAIVPSEPACQAMLAALRARLPHADLTQLPWAEAAARLGVSAQAPWFADWRVVGGVVLMAASAIALALPTRPRGGSELAGYAFGAALVSVLGLVLVIVGLVRRRSAG